MNLIHTAALSGTLDNGQFNIVYNMLSLGLAAMLFTSIFLFVAKDRVLPRYRMAVMVSGTVTANAAYLSCLPDLKVLRDPFGDVVQFDRSKYGHK